MQLAAISVAALGACILIALGSVVLFFGITADTADDFPFHRYPWVRPVAAVSILAVGQSFLILFVDPRQGVAAFLVFAAAAGYITFRWWRQPRREP